VATILSAQCTDEKVNEVTAVLFEKYRMPEDYVRVPEDELRADIKPTGFFNQKAASIRAACARMIEAYDGRVPDTMQDLITLRGVARKTANIVLGNAYGIVEGVAVDTHVRRLANRLGFSEESDPDKIEQDLMRLIPKKRWFDFTYVLIDHGRAICIAEAEMRRMPGERAVPGEPRLRDQPTATSDEARRRARRISRRSSSERPPQTPASWAVASDHSRHSMMTGQSRQMALARSACSAAGRVVPTGKNRSGSTPMQRATETHSIRSSTFLNVRSIWRATRFPRGSACL
jgi:endonuclease-3